MADLGAKGQLRDEEHVHRRLDAARCLKNAHGHIAHAYARLDDPVSLPGDAERAVRDTIDAVDWIRRALERMCALLKEGERDE